MNFWHICANLLLVSINPLSSSSDRFHGHSLLVWFVHHLISVTSSLTQYSLYGLHWVMTVPVLVWSSISASFCQVRQWITVLLKTALCNSPSYYITWRISLNIYMVPQHHFFCVLLTHQWYVFLWMTAFLTPLRRAPRLKVYSLKL